MRGNRFNEIVEKCGKEYIYRKLAEECCEFAQAALKVIRAERKETPMRMDEAWERFLEEFGDVLIMMQIVEDMFFTEYDLDVVCDLTERKEKRMYERLLDGKMEEDVW